MTSDTQCPVANREIGKCPALSYIKWARHEVRYCRCLDDFQWREAKGGEWKPSKTFSRKAGRR